MKTLTIEELKALEVGDWIWVVGKEPDRACYLQKDTRSEQRFNQLSWSLSYSDYGKTWLAYKNKEQAEAKGEIMELMCEVGDEIFVPWIWGDSDGIMNLTVTSITWRDNEIDYYCNNFETDDINFAKQFDLGNFHSVDYNSIWLTDQPEAERHLAELKGE